MKKLIFLGCLLLVQNINLQAQIPVAQREAVNLELQKKGLSEEEVEQRLRDEGINLDNINPSDPGEMTKVQDAVKKVIETLESEKIAAEKKEKIEKDEENLENKIEKKIEAEAEELAKESAKDIEGAVEDGASVQEAIAEELSENALNDLKKSPIYGQHVFRNQSISVYRSDGEFNPPDAYILGSGDKISISIWGISQADMTFVIGEYGYIKPTAMPRIDLGGKTFGQAKKMLLSRFSQYYQFRPEEFDMTVKTARVITVNIFGEAQSYGSFTIPAYNTAFNALVAAGGPSDIGSVRDIRLIRGNKTKKLDVYKYMNDPTVQFDFYLENNDIIYIPIAEKLISLNGAVKRPFTYELLPNENLAKLIEFAGGLNTNAYQRNIQITRIDGDKEILIDLDLRDLIKRNEDFELKNGDRISIKKIPESFENFVEISGAVKLPGKYALQNEMRISDLILKGRLDDEARLDFAYLHRTRSDNTPEIEKISLKEIIDNPNSTENYLLKKEDKITILALPSYVDRATVSIEGAVRSPNSFPFDPGRTLKLEDIVLLAGGLEKNANQFAYIQRIDTTNRERRDFIRVNVFKALQDPTAGANIILEPFDKVVIYSNESFTDDATVFVSGAVRNPREILYDSTLRVSDLIYLSNGLKPNAIDFGYIVRSDLTNRERKEYIRIDVKTIMENPNSEANMRLKPFDRLTIYSNELFSEKFFVSISGAILNEGQFQYDPSLNLKDVITLAGGFKLQAAKNRIDIFRVLINQNKPTETIVAQLAIDSKFNIVSGDPNFELFPFDKIVVRSVPGFELQKMVKLEGEVLYPGTYALTNNNERLSSLIERAGGITEEAFPAGATLRRSEGGYGKVILRLDRVLKRKRSEFNYVMKAGDEIFIPKLKDLVSISGATDINDLYFETVSGNGGRVNVPYKKGRRARYYIRKFTGGVSDRGTWKKVTVEYPNGEIKKAMNFGLFSISPKVRPGSEIKVGVRVIEEKDKSTSEKIEPNTVDWDKTLSQILSVTSVIATLLIAINR